MEVKHHLIKLRIWRMEEEERVEVFQGQIKEERFQFVRDGDTTYMVQLDMPKADKTRGRSRESAKPARGEARPSSTPNPPRAPCPHCGRSFLVGRGLNRHLKSCPKKPKASRPKKKASEQVPTTKAQEIQPVKETKEQAS